MYACAHERRSPSTQRLIDASSYGWVYRFIQDHGVEAQAPHDGADWLESYDASPRKLGEYFKRVALRLRHTEAFDYAASLEKHFTELADSKEYSGQL